MLEQVLHASTVHAASTVSADHGMSVPRQTECQPRINQTLKSEPTAGGTSADHPPKPPAGLLPILSVPVTRRNRYWANLKISRLHLFLQLIFGPGSREVEVEEEVEVREKRGSARFVGGGKGHRRTDRESRGGPANIRGRAELSAKFRSRLSAHLCQGETEEH